MIHVDIEIKYKRNNMQVLDHKIVCGDPHVEIILDNSDPLDKIIYNLICAAKIKAEEEQNIIGQSRVLNRVESAHELLKKLYSDLDCKLYSSIDCKCKDVIKNQNLDEDLTK